MGFQNHREWVPRTYEKKGVWRDWRATLFSGEVVAVEVVGREENTVDGSGSE